MRKELIDRNAVLKLSIDFAVLIIGYCDVLQDQKKFILANQLLKCGTAIGANIMEAQNAESRSDFIHKMKIAAKEAEETQYWLLLCSRSNSLPSSSYLEEPLARINKLLGRIIFTAKGKITTR